MEIDSDRVGAEDIEVKVEKEEIVEGRNGLKAPGEIKRWFTKTSPTTMHKRVVVMNADEMNDQTLYPKNYVKTTKYTLLSFIPKALILQFKRLANIYFLVIAILQSIPTISPLNPFTAWLPLIFVLFVSMAREGYEDYLRYREDKSIYIYIYIDTYIYIYI